MTNKTKFEVNDVRKVGQFGEPWEFKYSIGAVLTSKGVVPNGPMHTVRILDCVNAMAGIEKPIAWVEAVKEMLELIDDGCVSSCNSMTQEFDTNCDCGTDSIRRKLTKARGGVK